MTDRFHTARARQVELETEALIKRIGEERAREIIARDRYLARAADAYPLLSEEERAELIERLRP